jgi:hypothetical protein
MSDTPGPAKATDPHFESNAVAGIAAAPRTAGAVARRTLKSGAAAWKPPAFETARLAGAVAVAVALGAACGLWIQARFARAAFTAPPARSEVSPAGSAAPEEAATHVPAAGSATGERSLTPAETDETVSPPVSGDSTADEAVRENLMGEGDKRAPMGESAPEKTEVTPRSKAAAAGRGRGIKGPCALYTSVAALGLPAGGAASLVLGVSDRPGAVSVTTPNWSDIAVFSEGRAGGAKGWVRYTVRSVSKRPGTYAVHVKSPCGSETIPVTVARP